MQYLGKMKKMQMGRKRKNQGKKSDLLKGKTFKKEKQRKSELRTAAAEDVQGVRAGLFSILVPPLFDFTRWAALAPAAHTLDSCNLSCSQGTVHILRRPYSLCLSI